MHLDAITDGSSIVLRWSTASETDNAGFFVEQARRSSDDDSDWMSHGFVDGHGTTSDQQEYSFRIAEAGIGLHRFRLKQVDFDGAFEYSAEIEAFVEVPDDFVLEAAYPNPFNPTTTIRFAIARKQHVTATLHDSQGRVVSELYSGAPATDQFATIRVDGDGLASGTYQVRLVGETFVAVEQVMLVK